MYMNYVQSTGSPQNMVNDMPYDQRSHDSGMSGDVLSVSHALDRNVIVYFFQK